MSILITGAAGYIGSHVAYEILKTFKGKLVLLDDLSTGSNDALAVNSSKTIIEIFSLHSEDKLRSLFNKYHFESVFHFAGSIVNPESIDMPLEYYHNNVQGSLNLLNMCKEFGVKKFIFSSTAAVYGISKGGECMEASSPLPFTPYGRSKLMTEWMLEDLAVTIGMKYVIFRYFNAAGASLEEPRLGQRSKVATHLIKKALIAIKTSSPLHIFGTDYGTTDGSALRDYIHVDDLACAHVMALDYLDKYESDTFNLGTGTPYSVREVLAMIEEVTGKTLEKIDSPRRKGDVGCLFTNPHKANEILKFKTKHSDLKTIIKSAWDFESTLN